MAYLLENLPPPSAAMDITSLDYIYIYFQMEETKKGELQIERGVEIESVCVVCFVGISGAIHIHLFSPFFQTLPAFLFPHTLNPQQVFPPPFFFC